MKAAVLRKFGENLEIEELSIPDLDKNQVLVDIKFTGICGAQINQKKGIKIEEKFLPCLMGHEGSGVVLAVGPKVNKVKSGDHVVLHWRKSSGVDSNFPNFYSKSAQENIGAGLITTFSEQSIVSENRITKIDPHHPLDIASLLGCGVTTGIGIINNELNISSNSSFVISGVGGVGISTIMGAKLKEAEKIIALDLSDDKLNFAHSVGSTHEINIADNSNFDKEIMDITNENGVEYAIDTTGNGLVIDKLLNSLKPGGSLVLVGQPKKNENLVISNFLKLYKGINIFDSQGGLTNPEEDIPKILSLHDNGILDLSILIERKISLNEINKGFEMLENHMLVGSRILIENK
jgi:S-(hydroxymethyl)glutathione dehydrogenase / alcohol dehydrogenase